MFTSEPNSNLGNVLTTDFANSCLSLGSDTNGSKSYGSFEVEIGSYYALTSHSPGAKAAKIEGCDVICQATCCGNLNSTTYPGTTTFIVKATATTIKVGISWGGALCMKLDIPNIDISKATIEAIDGASGKYKSYQPTLGHIYIVAIASAAADPYVVGGLTAITVSGGSTLNGTTGYASLTLLKATTELLYMVANWGGACIVDLNAM